MRLTEEQIRFIDSYLKDAGVEYLDIRCEMTDHVAAALEEQEGEFRDNFKRYMLLHKKGLLASNRKFRWLAGRKAVYLLLKNLVRVSFLLILASLFCVMYFLSQAYTFEIVTDNFFTGFILAILGLMVYNSCLKLSGRSKFSLTNSVLGISSTIIYLGVIPFRIERWVDSSMVILSYYCFFLAFMIEVVLTFRQLKKKYILQYGS